ncbi:MAG: hypothetical protein N5P05_000875 [Chroococcopsis gigantea SAG 12.99]|jgi:membrane-associated phospholipid phosphatase|nr:phosphatase PAP2 family protein [Chlorogloea purpurea SAG 13.99]MDV2999269.1 hypothetical protein [Chroococcopsis gigantea SAG 12.99]
MKYYQILALLFGGIYLPLLVFFLLAVTIWYYPMGLGWEVNLLETVHKTSSPELDKLARVLTNFGTYLGVAPATAIFSLIFLARRNWYRLTYVLISLWGCWGISYTMKLLFHRLRPNLWELFYPLPLDFAFPSGHALSSMTLAATGAILAWGSPWFILVSIGGIIFSLSIAWTRLYLGVHFPTDIIAGWMLAISWAIGVHIILQGIFKPMKSEIKLQ